MKTKSTVRPGARKAAGVKTFYHAPARKIPADQVHGHLLVPFILLATWETLWAETYPDNGSFNTDLLYKFVDKRIVPPTVLDELAKEKKAFYTILRVWARVAGYDQPPCLDEGRMRRLIAFTKKLAPKPAKSLKGGVGRARA